MPGIYLMHVCYNGIITLASQQDILLEDLEDVIAFLGRFFKNSIFAIPVLMEHFLNLNQFSHCISRAFFTLMISLNIEGRPAQLGCDIGSYVAEKTYRVYRSAKRFFS